MKRFFGVFLRLCTCLVLLAFAGAAQAQPLRQQRVAFPVQLSSGQQATVVGYLYSAGTPRWKPLQVLVHGASYNHKYWDAPPVNGEDYSYARYMAERGYAVLALDEIGTGESSRPPGGSLTLLETAGTVHQVLRSLRGPFNPVGHRFGRIALVGHSTGSAVLILTQALYHDGDALVTTGFAHGPFVPALDPLVVLQVLAQEYPLFPPAVRVQLFYSLAASDAAVRDLDNAQLADVTPRGQVLAILAVLINKNLTLSRLVRGPVLAQMGDQDALFPGSLAGQEAAFYPNACLTVQVLGDQGHSVNLHRERRDGWAKIHDWLDSTL